MSFLVHMCTYVYVCGNVCTVENSRSKAGHFLKTAYVPKAKKSPKGRKWVKNRQICPTPLRHHHQELPRYVHKSTLVQNKSRNNCGYVCTLPKPDSWPNKLGQFLPSFFCCCCPGLPDYYWHNIPKLPQNIPNGHYICKYTKWP
jgi:hypothetical protein